MYNSIKYWHMWRHSDACVSLENGTNFVDQFWITKHNTGFTSKTTDITSTHNLYNTSQCGNIEKKTIYCWPHQGQLYRTGWMFLERPQLASPFQPDIAEKRSLSFIRRRHPYTAHVTLLTYDNPYLVYDLIMWCVPFNLKFFIVNKYIYKK